MTTWQDFAEAAPELAAAVHRRFAAHRHHLLATIRPSGAPRLSGTEVEFDDQVRIGMMDGSHKLDDVRRDPRVELHSAPLEEDLAEGDAKLTGRLVPAGRIADVGGFAFVLDLERAALVRVEGEELVFDTWAPSTGTRTLRRT